MEKNIERKKIEYPYIPEDREIKYVDLDNKFMQAAKNNLDKAGCVKHPTSAVVVKGDKIIGQGNNAGISMEACPRWGSKTGTNYGPCKDTCKQEGHAEVTSVNNAIKNGLDTNGADLYLYGHWWCCKDCWDKMIEVGIKNVYLLENSQNLFNPKINLEMEGWGKPK